MFYDINTFYYPIDISEEAREVTTYIGYKDELEISYSELPEGHVICLIAEYWPVGSTEPITGREAVLNTIRDLKAEL